LRALLLALAALSLGGCRYHIEHVREGQVSAPTALKRLQPGETSLSDALNALGAPDGVEWTYDADVPSTTTGRSTAPTGSSRIP
jgi:outer membrane protein assembly factor BamE (lipoprotein component of BamABCDE complex)